MNKNFLITAAGGSVLTSILPQIKEIGFESIVFIDMDENVAIKYLVDNKKTFFYKSPHGKNKDYSGFIAKIIKKHNIKYIIPGADEEILKILNLKLAACFDDLTICACNNFKFADMCLNKSNLMYELNMAGFKTPKTFNVADLNCTSYRKMIAKPIFGHGSKDIYILLEKEICKYISMGLINTENYIFQELIIGNEYTVSVLGNGFVVPKRIIKKHGITIAAITEYNDEIIGQCRDLIHVFCLGKNNVFNVQGIIDEESNKFSIFEINPRLSTTSCLTYAAGINEVGMCLGISPYDKDSNYKIKFGVEMYRFNEQLFNNKNSGRTFLKEGIF